MTLPLNSFAFASCLLCPHLVQASIIMVCFPDWILIGISLEPHSTQKSIRFISYTNFDNQQLPLTQLKGWEELCRLRLS
jgi:hypothetical protein